MLRSLVALCIASGLAMGAAPLGAQEAAPTHVVMRYFKCNPQGQAVALMQEGRPVIDEMVSEGKFIGYGILTHNWGDEWNVVDFFTVDGLDSFFASFAEMTERLDAASSDGQEEEDDGPSFGEICTEHKDNIYSVIGPPTGN